MKQSRIIHILLVAVMLAVPTAGKAFMVDGIEYIFFDDLTAAVSDCVDNDTVRIPSHVTYEGKTYTVTCIRDFYNPYLHNYEWCKTVHVSLPNTVKTIEDEAFKDALKLRSIELGDSIVTIGASAFEKCWVMDSITIPGTVTSLGKRAFATCWHLTHLDLSGTSINEIGEETFERPSLVVILWSRCRCPKHSRPSKNTHSLSAIDSRNCSFPVVLIPLPLVSLMAATA